MSARRKIAVVSVLALGLCAHGQASVRVTVAETLVHGQARYSYRVTNRARKPIVAFRIGCDRRGEAQLTVPPVGWSLERGLARRSAAAPEGWVVRLVTAEESDRFTIDWSGEGGSRIAPGATLGGFTLLAPHATAQYRRPSFEVTLADATHLRGTAAPRR